MLYVNGDSHAAAAEAVNQHGWACDDSRYFYMGRVAHPDNLAVSWSRILSQTLKIGLNNGAQSGSSNARIRRTTDEFLRSVPDAAARYLVVIQWSTWERQEWLIDDQWYQIGASGLDSVPPEHHERYRQFVAEVDWEQAEKQEHEAIWQFHLDLTEQGIRHVFFNGDNWFHERVHDWPNSVYLDPYDPAMTYSGWLKNHGFATVSPKSWHFGRDAHAAWARFMLKYVVQHRLLGSLNTYL